MAKVLNDLGLTTGEETVSVRPFSSSHVKNNQAWVSEKSQIFWGRSIFVNIMVCDNGAPYYLVLKQTLF